MGTGCEWDRCEWGWGVNGDRCEWGRGVSGNRCDSDTILHPFSLHLMVILMMSCLTTSSRNTSIFQKH